MSVRPLLLSPRRLAAHYLITMVILLHNALQVTSKVFATQMSPRVIDTQYGKIRGVLITLPNRSLPAVEAYFGLQYASVLGGVLRFMPPTSPMEKWDGIRVALKFRPVCPQRIPNLDDLEQHMPLSRVNHFKRLIPFLEKQQEECLNLNIYLQLRGRLIAYIYSNKYYSNVNIYYSTKNVQQTHRHT